MPKKAKQTTKRPPEPMVPEHLLWKYRGCLTACTREFPSRTPYFYRKQAISWRQHLNFFEWFKGQHDTARYFAKMYLAGYRESLTKWAAAISGKGVAV